MNFFKCHCGQMQDIDDWRGEGNIHCLDCGQDCTNRAYRMFAVEYNDILDMIQFIDPEANIMEWDNFDEDFGWRV